MDKGLITWVEDGLPTSVVDPQSLPPMLNNGSTPAAGKVLWQLGREAKNAALELDSLFQEIFPEACEDDPGKVAALFESPRGHKSSRKKVTKEKKVVNA